MHLKKTSGKGLLTVVIGFNCHESAMAATEIDLVDLPRMELPFGLLAVGF